LESIRPTSKERVIMPRTRNLDRKLRDVYQPAAVVEAVAEPQPEGEQGRPTLAFFSVEGVQGMAHIREAYESATDSWIGAD
jgi:hypothetical protein